MSHETHFEVRTQAQYEYDRAHSKAHMRKQVVNFAIMIFLTFIAFSTVVAGFPATYIVPVVLLLAGIQVVLQLYAFMHLEDRSTHMVGVIEFFIWSGAFLAFTFFVAFTTIIWWG
ncbi:cytochrome B6 [Solibacillus sp. R5-41]|uniref:cytochrome C oxidase subunit IV family protein n=1 Tax=Solibacillus sp. R5-41 TaxID=2048654 RepID=UPI000C126630|nr:cytochrome C oxidase subunit IV family protein [Solibacillus sp. R5-41]ATP39223.1 cytochrome B6 [Solibacillus sp. R5-41]